MSNEASYTNTVSTGSPPRFVDVIETVNSVGSVTWRTYYRTDSRKSGCITADEEQIYTDTFTKVYSGTMSSISDLLHKIVVLGGFVYYISSYQKLVRIDTTTASTIDVTLPYLPTAYCYFNNQIWVVTQSSTSPYYRIVYVYTLTLDLVTSFNLYTSLTGPASFKENILAYKDKVFFYQDSMISSNRYMFSISKTYGVTNIAYSGGPRYFLYGEENYIYYLEKQFSSNIVFLKKMDITTNVSTAITFVVVDATVVANADIFNVIYYKGRAFLTLDWGKYAILEITNTTITLLNVFSNNTGHLLGVNDRLLFFTDGNSTYYSLYTESNPLYLLGKTIKGMGQSGTTLFFVFNDGVYIQKGAHSYLDTNTLPSLNQATKYLTATGLIDQLDNIISYTSSGDHGFNWDSSVAPTANGTMYAKFLNECRQIIDDLRNKEGNTMTLVNPYDSNNCTSSTCVFNCTAACFGSCATNCVSDGCTNQCTTSCVGGFTEPCSGCSGSCNAWCSTVCSGTCGHTVCVNQCSNSCTWVCSGNCLGYCYQTCNLSCYSGCANSARLGNPPSGCYLESCSGTCVGTCEGTCTGGCLTTCTGGCDTTCVSSCQNDCTGVCFNDCTGSCTGVSY